MIKYDCKIANSRIDNEVKDAQDLWADPRWIEFIKCLAYFELSKANGQPYLDGERFIANLKKFSDLNKPIEVVEYHTWRGVYGYVTPAKPLTIHLNSKFYGRSGRSIRNTIIHETIHVLDNHSPDGFGHGGNSPNGKQFTAPYFLGSVAQLWSVNKFDRVAVAWDDRNPRCGSC